MTCDFCGNDFLQKNARQKYCSTICKSRAGYKKRLGKTKVHTTTCQICGAIVTSHTHGRKTCGSRKCLGELRRRYKQRIRDELVCEFTLAECRAYYGMKPVSKGKLNCLMCGHKFMSEDTTNNRLCKACLASIQGVEVELCVFRD